MKPIIKKKLNLGYIAYLKKDLLLVLSHLERLEPRRREYFHCRRTFGNDIQSLIFLSGECD